MTEPKEGIILAPRQETMPEMLRDAQTKAKAIGQLIDTAKDSNGKPTLYANIQGKKYVRVEAWVTLARGYGYTPDIISEPTRIGIDDLDAEGKPIWGMRTCAGLRDMQTGEIVAKAYAESWSDEFTARAGRHGVGSMAQTRAISKVCRAALSWVMVLAGFEATPAEEMSKFANGKDGVDGLKDTLKAEVGLAHKQADEIRSNLESANAKPHLDNIMAKHANALTYIGKKAPKRALELEDLYNARISELGAKSV